MDAAVGGITAACIGCSSRCHPTGRRRVETSQRLHDWDGWRNLLDPPHLDLLREIVCYGEFVDAAYDVFLARLDTEPRDTMHIPLQDTAYRVNVPVFATSSVGLPYMVTGATVATTRGGDTRRSAATQRYETKLSEVRRGGAGILLDGGG